jgi:hypothetical protein
LAGGNPPYIDGDASRAVRTTVDPGYVIYRIEDTQGFYAHIYSHDSFAGIDFYASSNGTSWTSVATSTDTAVATDNGWKGKYYQNTNALPTGTQYIKVQFSSTTDFFVTQLSEMKIFDVYLDYN